MDDFSLTPIYDQTITIGTDSASWFIFHPDDLTHRQEDPMGWCRYDFAIQSEFAAGKLIAVDTGGDGSFSIRVTNGGLSLREQDYAVCSCSFRFKVQHGSLFMDGEYALPSDKADSPEDYPNQWLEFPNGNYQVTVYALAWYDEPGALDENEILTDKALASYVAAFETVDDLEAVRCPPSIPCIDPNWSIIMCRSDYLDFITAPISLDREEYPVLFRSEIVLPNNTVELKLNETEYNYIQQIQLIDSFKMIVSPSLEPNTIAVLFNSMSYGGQMSFSNFIEAHASFYGYLLVKINQIQDNNGIYWAKVEPYEPSSIEPTKAEDLAALKSSFAEYASTSSYYQRNIPYPRFNAEIINYISDTNQMAWKIANSLNLTAETKRSLLTLSETQLVQRLNKIIQTQLNS